MKQQLVHWVAKEEVAVAPYAAGCLLAVLAYVDSVLTSAHPSGQLDVALVTLGALAVKGAIIALRRRVRPA